MFLRPILICAAGVLALQLLTVRADSGIVPLEIPKGWSASLSVGRQYFVGYDSREKAYYIENIGAIEPIGRLINADTVPTPGGHHVPYSAEGMRPTDRWAASLLQSVRGAPYVGRKLRLAAEIKSSAFNGEFCLLLRADDLARGEQSNSSSCVTPGRQWQTFSVDMEEGPDSDQSVLAFGFLQQGEGKVLFRNVQLDDLPPAPKPPKEHNLWSMFGLPPANEQPVNVELAR